MPLPVDRRSIEALFAGGGEGSAEQRPDPYADRPWQSPQEGFAVSTAGRLAQIPAEELAAIRPDIPQVLFPPEFGYDTTPPTIEDILDTGRWVPQIRSWVSPGMRSPERADFDAKIQSGPTPAMSVNPYG